MTAQTNGMANSGIAVAMPSLVRADGSATAAHLAGLCQAGTPLRDLADAIHALCVIHGSFPGIVDHALSGAAEGPARAWLVAAAERASVERALLARLAAAAGPQPSTPGHAASEAAVYGQRSALAMLARSDRSGCAIGTALAFALDWAAIRQMLDHAALRTGVARSDAYAPHIAHAHAALEQLVTSPAVDRAMMFGAQQLLAQHRGLWQLLEARAQARRDRD